MEDLIGQEWQNGAAAQMDMRGSLPSGLSAFLAWLMLWLHSCLAHTCLARREHLCEAECRPYQLNRQRRRMSGCSISPVRNNRPYFILAGRGRTLGQFNEWLAHYSGRGRVRVYHMPYWRKTVKGKACPLGTEHEYWRDPLEHMSGRLARLFCGVWAAHIWPGWRGWAGGSHSQTKRINALPASNFPCPNISVQIYQPEHTYLDKLTTTTSKPDLLANQSSYPFIRQARDEFQKLDIAKQNACLAMPSHRDLIEAINEKKFSFA